MIIILFNISFFLDKIELPFMRFITSISFRVYTQLCTELAIICYQIINFFGKIYWFHQRFKLNKQYLKLMVIVVNVATV